MATAKPPNPPTKDENKPASASAQSYPGISRTKPTRLVFTDFASI